MLTVQPATFVAPVTAAVKVAGPVIVTEEVCGAGPSLTVLVVTVNADENTFGVAVAKQVLVAPVTAASAGGVNATAPITAASATSTGSQPIREMFKGVPPDRGPGMRCPVCDLPLRRAPRRRSPMHPV